ncbi:MAG TPA: hypothetical protein VI916_05700 [Acidimicrobiia bacterium]|nr:hypothetical protein [Acidimicrobiia bacterium]
MNDHELTIFSQNGEDGILGYIFNEIGVESASFVEVGVSHGFECNTAYLALERGWRGILIDGDHGRVAEARRRYSDLLDQGSGQVVFRQAFISAENFSDLLLAEGVGPVIDLLSLDIDGNEYWIWKGLEGIHARVVVVEYNASFGADRALTIPYDPHFQRNLADPLNHGASLAALTKLGKTKGYSLVGCDSMGANAFFVRSDQVKGPLKELDVAQAWMPHARRLRHTTQIEQERRARKYPLVEV